VVLDAGLRVAVLVLSAGMDPDDVVREAGSAAFEEMLSRPHTLVQFLLDELPEDAGSRRRAAAQVAEVVGSARDPLTRDELFFELSQRVGFSPEVLRDLARKGSSTSPAGRSTARTALSSGDAMLTRIAIDGGPRWRRVLATYVEPATASDPRVGRLLELLRADRQAGERDDVVGVVREHGDSELQVLVAEVATRGGPELSDESVRRQLTLLLREQARSQATRLNQQIATAEAAGDDQRVAELQRQKAELRTRPPEL
jgi:DNA primase